MSIADKLTTIAENQQAVYQAGYNKGEGDAGAGAYQVGYETGHAEGFQEGKAEGFQEGKSEGFADGKQAEYDRFWDAVHASIRNYGLANAFSGAAWTKDTFRPKQSILNDENPYMTFRGSKIDVDLPAYLEELGVEITFKPGVALQYTFYNTWFTRLGTFDLRDRLYLNNCFDNSNRLVTIDKIICNNKTTFNGTFQYCSALENIVFEGELAKNGLNLQWSTKLSKASITSVINVLSGSTSGLTVTMSKTAVTNAFGSTTAAEWTALVATKSNWTISLV